MNDKNEIESLVLSSFSFLQIEFGFHNPVLNRDTCNTTISYLSKEIGIEIELDWRDLNVFILITKLDKGKLPKGYYVSNGKVCRVHLEEVLQKGLNVGKEEIQNIIQYNNIKAQKRNQINKNDIAVKIEKYQQLLHSYAGAICSVGVNLFP